MREICVLNKKIYLNPKTGNFSYSLENLNEIDESSELIIRKLDFNSYSSLTICLGSSISCNMDCIYCFSKKNKNNNKPIFSDFIPLLDMLFNNFSNRYKFYLDLSGDREPLLNMDFIKDAIYYAKNKSESLRKEVLVTFVTNGLLLTENIVDYLQDNGVIFGVSLDGYRHVQNINRPLKNGGESYETLISNIKKIKNKDFLGCALTLGKIKFDLYECIVDLLKYFPTISIKPARLSKDNKFSVSDIEYWINEYKILATKLIEHTLKGDLKLIYSLLNGDDYYGKFILRSILNIKANNRCDVLFGRIFISSDLNLSCCVPLYQFKEYKYKKYNELIIKGNKKVEEVNKVIKDKCIMCDYNKLCGGECIVEYEINGDINKLLCYFKQNLINLAMYFSEEIAIRDITTYNKLFDFCYDKVSRNDFNEEFSNILNINTEKTFAECKKIFYDNKKSII